MTTISVKLPPALARRLAAFARRRKQTKAAIICETLEQRLPAEQPSPRRPSFYELTKYMCGCVKGTPPDLSTNPKYMEGFGR